MLLSSSKNKCSASKTSQGSTSLVQSKSMDNYHPSRSYFYGLGKCIIEIFSGIYLVDQHLLTFCSLEFQKKFIDTFLSFEGEEQEEFTEQTIQFLSMLKEYALNEGQMWPLNCIVGPTLAKYFHLIQSTVSF